MDILINLKSRAICEALTLVLQNSDNRYRTFLAPAGDGAAGCNPDMIIADAGSLNQALFSRWPTAKLLLIDTGLSQEDIIALLLSYKIDGILSTDADTALLRKALDVMHQGQIWIDNRNLKAFLRKAGTISKNQRLDGLSKREHEVLDLVVQGHKNKEIAARLFLSEPTVKVHVSRMLRKFDVANRSQLIAHVMRNRTDRPE